MFPLRSEIKSSLRSFFFIVTYFSLRHNHVIKFLIIKIYFHHVRTTFLVRSSHLQKLRYNYSSGQNIWNKVEKSSKAGQIK